MLRLPALISAFLLCLVALIPSTPAYAAPVPSGSYLDSCKGVAYDPATHLLSANCISADEGGQFEIGTSPLDTTDCAEGSIWNDDGQLYCLAATAWGKGTTIPKGSYINTCTRRSVMNNVLIAECGRRGSGSLHANLNLNERRWGGDISNDDGILKCETAALRMAPIGAPAGGTGASPLVKPVDIAPMVKPEIIPAPPTPEPAAASDSADGEKKRKKKRDRGERG